MVVAKAVCLGFADYLCLFGFVDLQTEVVRIDQTFLAGLAQALLERAMFLGKFKRFLYSVFIDIFFESYKI